MIEQTVWRWLGRLAMCVGLGLGHVAGAGAFAPPVTSSSTPSLAPATGPQGPAAVQPLASQNLADLPEAARRVYARILSGGPFTSDKDGSVFFNRERKLPVRARGAYREYTVPTPGARNRGTRRIVCAGAARAPEVCYYTADHYETFNRIQP